MGLADEYRTVVDDQADNWCDLFFHLILPDESRLDEARLTMAPAQLERVAGSRELFTFRVSHTQGYGAYDPLTESCLRKLDDHGITGTLTLERVLHDVERNYTQGPVVS